LEPHAPYQFKKIFKPDGLVHSYGTFTSEVKSEFTLGILKYYTLPTYEQLHPEHEAKAKAFSRMASCKVILQNITTPLRAWEGKQPFWVHSVVLSIYVLMRLPVDKSYETNRPPDRLALGKIMLNME